MQAYFAAGLLTAAAEAVNADRSPYFSLSDYINTNSFAIYYPSYEHDEEQETEEERIIQKKYKHTSRNPFTSSDSENNFSSDSNDYSGPSFTSRSGDSASSSGSNSHKYSYAGDSASDYYHSASSSDSSKGRYYTSPPPAYTVPVYDPYYYQPAPPTYVDIDARCARVDFDWNYLGVEGTLDFYQPHHSPLLADGSFKSL